MCRSHDLEPDEKQKNDNFVTSLRQLFEAFGYVTVGLLILLMLTGAISAIAKLFTK